MPQPTRVPSNTDLKLRLIVGGDLPYKWKVYEYLKDGAPPSAVSDGEGKNDGLVPIARVQPGQTRRFLWSVAAFNLDAAQEVNVRAQSLAAGQVVGSVASIWKVNTPADTCFIHFDLIGSAP